MKAFFLACVLALAAVPAHADTVMAIVSSDATEWIGQGQQQTYTSANATFTVSGDKSRLQVRVAGTDGKTWDLRLKAPVGDEFRPHEFFFAEREGFETGRAPSMDFSGDGRACGDVYGDFSIRQIGYDATGKVNMLEAVVLQRCDSGTAPPLALVVRYRASKLSFTMNSTPQDWTGGNLKVALYNDTSVFGISGGSPGFTYTAEGMGTDYMLILQPPYGEPRFKKGTYLTYRFQTGLIAGMDFSGNGRGENESWGKLEILSIAYNAYGEVAQISARYWFYADEARTQVLRSGGINYWK